MALATHIQETNQVAYDAKKVWHEQQRTMPLKDKMRVLLALQIASLPLIARQRPLKPHERPWPVEP